MTPLPEPCWPPRPRGPLSAGVISVLFSQAPPASATRHDDPRADARGWPGAEPLDPETVRRAVELPPKALVADDDVQLAFFLLAERSFGLPGADPCWEGHPALAWPQRVLADAFEGALRELYGAPDEGLTVADVAGLLPRIAGDPDPRGLAGYVARHATLDQVREMLISRSPYQLKEADPHSLALARLRGAAKAALLEIQYDEYGAAHYPASHQALFADAMRLLGLDATRYVYLDAVPATALAQHNALTLFALDGRLRGALAGHFAVFELGSSVPMTWYARGLRRLGAPAGAIPFFDVHVEADAVHEQIAVRDLCGGLLRDEPALLGDVVFGARVSAALDGAASRDVLEAWQEGRSALRTVAAPIGR